jgi:hypothetical protein
VPQVTSLVDAWGGSWGTTWDVHWTYTAIGGSSGAGGAGSAVGKRGGRRYPYLNIIDDAHLLPQYQELQRQNARQRRTARRVTADETVDENDPVLVRVREYLARITGKG